MAPCEGWSGARKQTRNGGPPRDSPRSPPERVTKPELPRGVQDRVQQAGEAGVEVGSAQGVEAGGALLALKDHAGLAAKDDSLNKAVLEHADFKLLIERPDEAEIKVAA